MFSPCGVADALKFLLRFVLKNTSGKQKRGCDFRELDFWSLRSQHSETLKKQNIKKRKRKKRQQKCGSRLYCFFSTYRTYALQDVAKWYCSNTISPRTLLLLLRGGEHRNSEFPGLYTCTTFW